VHAARRIGFAIRGPWETRYTIDGRTYGGDFDPADDLRIRFFQQAFPDARRVLEIGSYEGGHTFQLAGRAAEVVAVESRPANLRRARYVQRLLEVGNVRWVQADVETEDLSRLGRFDATLCSGVLYHLPEPSRLLDQLPKLAPGVLIWTHLGRTASAEHDGFVGEWFDEIGVHNPTSGMSPRSFWPTLDSLLGRLEGDWGRVEVVEQNDDHPNGPAATIVCHEATAASRA
jgi:hypothetical protein